MFPSPAEAKVVIPNLAPKRESMASPATIITRLSQNPNLRYKQKMRENLFRFYRLTETEFGQKSDLEKKKKFGMKRTLKMAVLKQA
jgi:hypothetical protein